MGPLYIACLTAMTQGNFSSITANHWKVALVTGAVAGMFGVALSFTHLSRHDRPWLSFALITFLSTPGGPPQPSDPRRIGLDLGSYHRGGATVLSLSISFGPLAAAVERLEKHDFRS